jgi:transcription elongation factor Elf1
MTLKVAAHGYHRRPLLKRSNMPDDNAAGNFIHFAEQPPKRKRAEAVCVHCHSKKIKCDVQKRTEAGQAKCSNCDNSQRDCHIRNSQRGRRKQTGTSNDIADHVNATRSPQDGSTAERSHNLPCDLDGHDGQLTGLTPASAARSGNTIHADDIDAGYLQVYGPENQLDAQLQEFQAMPLHGQDRGNAQLTDNGLVSTFLETYWEHCYCFCPVLDRATISDEIARSPMLANAISLAASHIQPPLLPHEGSERYYNKARMLFYEDGEPDNLVALKALSLFYWWAPRPPSTIHRHTSWWWQSVIIRHAQQMGVHREPPVGDPIRARLDLSARRRIWWTAFVSPS